MKAQDNNNLQNQHQDWLTMLLLKSALAVVGACGIGYAGYTYKTINEFQEFKLKAEKAFVEINVKLDLALQDIQYHHGRGEVKISK